MRRLPILTLGLTTLLAAPAGCSKKQEPAAAAGEEAPGKGGNPLAKVANGSWSGPYGTITFKDDGTVDLNLKNCAHSEPEPGVIEMSPTSGCSDEKRAGKLEISDGQLGVVEGEVTYNYAAYVDGAGKLHLGIAGSGLDVSPLGKDRKGSFKASMFATVTIGDTCTVKDEMKDKTGPVACKWVEKGGRTILVYDQEDRFKAGKMDQVGVVHLADVGLLVSPVLEAMAFEKK
jgi:hypothetical protein